MWVRFTISLAILVAGEHTSPHDRTAQLQRAILLGDTRTAHSLIRSGVPHATAPGAQTALMLASYRGHAETVALLLQHGADISARHTADPNGRGRSALVYAVEGEAERNRREHGKTLHGAPVDADRVVSTLLRANGRAKHSRKASATAKTPPIGYWNAVVAAGAGRLKSILHLLLAHCDGDTTCARTSRAGAHVAPVVVAILKSHHVLHKVASTYLLRPDVKASDDMSISRVNAFKSWGFEVPRRGVVKRDEQLGQSVDPTVIRPLMLDWAAQLVDSVIDACHAHGWDCKAMIETPDQASGDRPLHAAAEFGCLHAVTRLLAEGANPMATNHNGQTAAQVSQLHGYTQVTDMFTAVVERHCASSTDCDRQSHFYAQPKQSTPIQCSRSDWSFNPHVVEYQAAHAWPPIDYCPGGIQIMTEVESSAAATPLHDIFTGGAPVLFRRAASSWPAITDWGGSLTALADKFGNHEVAVAAIPYANQFGLPSQRQKLADYVASLRSPEERSNTTADMSDVAYVFDADFFRRVPEAAADIKIPKPFENSSKGAMQFMAGPPGAGAPVHFHKSAWNACVFGRKQWAFFPPNISFMSSQPVDRWWSAAPHDEWAAAGVRIVVQNVGDVVYVPSGWGHAVRNLESSAAIAVEIGTST